MSFDLDRLARARQHGLCFAVNGDRMRLTAPQKPADDLRADLRAHKAELLALQSGEVRAWAEGFAQHDRSTPLPGFTPHRWQQLTDDGALFLDQRAAELRPDGVAMTREWATSATPQTILPIAA